MCRRVALGIVVALALWPAGPVASVAATGQPQPAARRKPQVEMVQLVGCVEERTGNGWWLTRASEPEVSRAGVFNQDQVDAVLAALELGTREFQLVGVADFLDAEGLLATGNRADFTSADQVNATGELRPGRTVLVKGLLIEGDDVSRVNLTTVVGLPDRCQ
jgi:hypothetical protein